MASVARPREQTARRQDLVQAAARAIGERGLSGVRIKDVAAEAGLSAGLVSYYYPDFDDLLADVHQDAVDRFYWSRLAAVEQADQPVAQLLALVEQGVPERADDLTCTVLYELHLHASRSRTHAALMTSLYDQEVSLYARVLRSGREHGVFSMAEETVGVVAANAVALEDAYGLHVVGRNAHVDPRQARSNILAYLAIATGAALAQPHGRRVRRTTG
jgi:AcrR family transcriptional regulator